MARGNKSQQNHIRPNMIGEQLPYYEFEHNERSKFHRVHLLRDGSLAVCWKTPVPKSYSVDEGVQQTINELRTFMEGLPQGYEVQISITSHNNLSEKLKFYLQSGSGSERGQVLRQSRAEKLLEAGFSGYAVGEGLYSMLRETYMIISLRAPDLVEQLGLAGQAANALYQAMALPLNAIGIDLGEKMDGYLNKLIKSPLNEFQQALISTETTLNKMFELERIDLKELKKHYWTAFSPSFREPGQNITIDPNRPLNDQMFPQVIESNHDIVKLGSDYHGVIMLAMLPDTVGPDYFGILRRLLPTQHTVFVNVAQANQMAEKLKLTVDVAMRQRIASVFSKEEVRAMNRETSQVKENMFEGRKIMYMMFGIIVHGYTKEEVEDRLLRINSEFKKLSVVPDIERSMALQATSYSWPLVWRKDMTQVFARTRRIMSADMCDLLPVHGHWQGHKQPQSLYINRDGELTFFDHTSTDFVNWHYAITGTSGSGKSFLVVDLTLQLYGAGIEKQYLLTIKDDYDRFGKTMGKLVIIDLDNQESCINPFAGEITKQRLQQWSTAVELMLAKGSGEQAGRDEQRLIEQIVEFAYEMVPEGDVLRPTWIREAFYKFPYVSEEQRRIGMQDAEEIGSFCSDGVYGKLFDDHPVIDETDRIVVFNLQNVLSEKIADVIVYSIFTMLDNVMYQGDRRERKHLLIDEMISMISSKGGRAVAEAVKRAFRTYRSLNCMCGIASQNEEDLTTEVGQAVIGNLTKRIMMKPRREMIPMLMEALGMQSERHRHNLQALETKPGYYSEFYLVSPHGEVICRLLTDKVTYALATTTPDDVVELERFREETGSYWEAAIRFAETYPNGVRAARALSQRKAQQEANS